MDEVSDPAMAVLAEGFFFFFFKGGLKLHILNKIKDTSLKKKKKQFDFMCQMILVKKIIL